MLGASKRTAALPATAACSPADLAANVLQAPGVDTSTEIQNALGRPFPINPGAPIPWWA